MDGELHEPPQPVPEGFWMTLLGATLAVLAPLAGFLAGSATGAVTRPGAQGGWLVAGLVLGGLGVLCAFVGALRWWRASRD